MASRFLFLALILWLSIVDSQLTIVNRDFKDAIRSLTSPALEQRKKSRREFQQRHYAEILYELAMMDAPGALLAAVRSRTQLELQLPSTPLTVTIPVNQPPPPPLGLPGFTGQPSPPMVVPLFEDRRFPADPWSIE